MKHMTKTGTRSLFRRTVPIVFVALIIFVAVFMVLNSFKPDKLPGSTFDTGMKGETFIRANLAIILRMQSNWLPNDVLWPTVLLDNIPNFQLGELEVVRYNTRILRDNLSRMRTTDKLDPHAEEAFTSLSNDPFKWWFPRAENKWKTAHTSLDTFLRNMKTGHSQFYARADNLVELLNQYASLMGGANTRLMNAPGDIHRSLAVEEPGQAGSTRPPMVDIDVPWHLVDDNFYYAQGIAYALYESFRAVRVDFIDVLTDKNSVSLVDKILENLDRCRFEPLIVFNGNPGSIFANHSLNLSGVFNDARQKIQSLTVALKQG